MDEALTVTQRRRALGIGLAGLGLGLAHVGLDQLVVEDSPDWRGFAIAAAVLVAAFAGGFGLLVPWLLERGGPGYADPPATTSKPRRSREFDAAFGLVAVTLVCLLPQLLWLGLAYVSLAAAVTVGWVGLDRHDATDRDRTVAVARLLGVVLAGMVLVASVLEWQD